MGLSQSRSDRNTATQKESIELSPTRLIAWQSGIEPGTPWRKVAHTIRQASQLSLWLEAMLEQLQKTATALRTEPSTVISLFQKTLSRPSYFYGPAESTEWLILLGPPARPAPIRTWRPASDLKSQGLRLIKRFWLEGSRIHAELESLNSRFDTLRLEEILPECQRSRRLGRRARVLQIRMGRVQLILQTMKKQSVELEGVVLIYNRMLALQVQRFYGFIETAGELSLVLRNAYRLRQKSETRPVSPALVLKPKADARSSWLIQVRYTLQFLRQWLMHPVIDTRGPSETV